jgi:hypothetical protein
MNAQLKQLILADEKIIKNKFDVLRKDKDPEHYERRKQQRAITEEIVHLCLAYGEKKRIRGALTYTILDKNLKSTIYNKYLEKVRGLRVVLNNIDNINVGIHTVYWVDKVKKK